MTWQPPAADPPGFAKDKRRDLTLRAAGWYHNTDDLPYWRHADYPEGLFTTREAYALMRRQESAA